jgi:hypothetical protein
MANASLFFVVNLKNDINKISKNIENNTFGAFWDNKSSFNYVKVSLAKYFIICHHPILRKKHSQNFLNSL